MPIPQKLTSEDRKDLQILRLEKMLIKQSEIVKDAVMYAQELEQQYQPSKYARRPTEDGLESEPLLDEINLD